MKKKDINHFKKLIQTYAHCWKCHQQYELRNGHNCAFDKWNVDGSKRVFPLEVLMTD